MATREFSAEDVITTARHTRAALHREQEKIRLRLISEVKVHREWLLKLPLLGRLFALFIDPSDEEAATQVAKGKMSWYSYDHTLSQLDNLVLLAANEKNLSADAEMRLSDAEYKLMTTRPKSEE